LKLIRFGEPGREKPGVLLEGGSRLDASGFGADYDEKFFESGGITALSFWLDRNRSSAPRVDLAMRLGPPVKRPSKLVCIGFNYGDHAAETGSELPKEPVIFLKATSALMGPNDALLIPRNATKVDYEVELAVVIGKSASYVPKESALEFVAGYSLFNDFSERGFQFERGGQFTKGKSADTFAPVGPFLATRDEIPEAHKLALWLKVNGEMRQKSTTASMIFDIPTLVSYVTEFMTLLPGDIIATGTPHGVGFGRKPPVYLKPGDVVEYGIDGLGKARQRVEASR
jgi:2-keto-4-pentenoate hydratase/2-oxohepta-3-ene-1,7-dioic acid hydratase in catechol pathway